MKPGTRHRATRLAEKLMANDAEDVVKAVVAAAKGGDMTAARLVLDRIAPPCRGRPVRLVSITEPGGKVIEVDAPSGWTLAEARSYAERYHGPGCTVTPLLPLPTPLGAPADLDDALRAACEGVEGITPEVFRSLLSPEDLADIEGGGIRVPTLNAFAASFAEGIRTGRVSGLPMTTER